MAILHVFANSGDLDQMPHYAAADLGLHCLSKTLLRVSRLKRVNASGVINLVFGQVRV